MGFYFPKKEKEKKEKFKRTHCHRGMALYATFLNEIRHEDIGLKRFESFLKRVTNHVQCDVHYFLKAS